MGWSPWPILGCCLLYYYVVRVWGPSFMKNRPPYEIKSIMLAYNLFQTLFSAWMFYRTGTFWLTGRYSWVCEPVDYSNSPSALDAMDVTWWYFFSKFIDYIDSIFFVLRKSSTTSPLFTSSTTASCPSQPGGGSGTSA